MRSLTAAGELLGNLKADGFLLELGADGKLALSHPRRRPSPAMLAEIARLKPDLLELLRPPPLEAASPPPADPLEAVEKWRAGRVGPPDRPCPCGQCAREDAEARWAREDRWHGF